MRPLPCIFALLPESGSLRFRDNVFPSVIYPWLTFENDIEDYLIISHIVFILWFPTPSISYPDREKTPTVGTDDEAFFYTGSSQPYNLRCNHGVMLIFLNLFFPVSRMSLWDREY